VTPLLALLFVLSGAAGLIYESLWSRYLGLLVGHGAYAQVLVLVIFLGGMSLGAAWIAKRSENIRQPLLWYAAVEAIVGVLGLAFHDVFVGTSGFAYDVLFPALGSGTLTTMAKWALAALLILPQSILLGSTFPLMTAAVLRVSDPARAGSVLGLFYFANSLGAAVGVLLAGFWLLEIAGLPGTLAVAAMVNLVVALGAFVLARRGTVELPGRKTEDESNEDAASVIRHPSQIVTLLLTISFLTAAASFIYEIAWIRMLSLVLGSATHAFELMLSAFILGLAIGALLVRRRADAEGDPVWTLGIVQVAMGAAAILTLSLYVDAFGWMSALMQTLQRNASGYTAFHIGRYALAMSIMLPATICAGMTLPLITRALLRAGVGERAVGSVYAWNTLGSIVGAAAAGLYLLPLLGVRGTLILGGAIDLGLGCWLLWTSAPLRVGGRRTAQLALAASAAVVLVSAMSPGFDPALLSSGVFRYGSVPEPGARNILFYKDGRTASVSVQMGSDSGFTIATNGKPDASLHKMWFDEPLPDSARPALAGDNATQALLALITLAHAPQAREAAVIGHGAGMTTHFLLGSDDIERVTTIEIEPEMVEAAKLLLPANIRAFDDPRSELVIDDARAFFATADRKFDVIVSEPSNPWVSGVSALFTEEFYARAAQQLAPGGVFGQWLHLYEIEDELVLGILKALSTQFRSYELYLTNDVDVLVVASNTDSLPTPDWSVLRSEDVALDLARFRPIPDAALAATWLVGHRELGPMLARDSASNSDFYPQLDLRAERARYLGVQARGFASMQDDRFVLAEAIGERRVLPLGMDRAPLSHSRFDTQAMTVQLRRALAGAELARGSREAAIAVRAAALRVQRLNLELRNGRAPVDWQLWFAELLLVERDLHQGTMGTVDAAWYADVERFLISARAPEGALSAWRFLRSAVTYDWPRAAAEVPRQIAERDRGTAWLPPALLLDAAVLARLRTGDASGAQAAFARLSDAAGRSPDDVRTRMLEALTKP
jgi:spermidine synthase